MNRYYLSIDCVFVNVEFRMKNRTKQLGDEIRGVQISTAELKQLKKTNKKFIIFLFQTPLQKLLASY